MPICEELEKIQNNYLSQGQIPSGQKYSTLISQIWSCFPSFCSNQTWTSSHQNLLQSNLPNLINQMSKSFAIKKSIILGLHHCLVPSNLILFTQMQEKIIPTLFNSYLSTPDNSILLFLKNFPMTSPYVDKIFHCLIQKTFECKQGSKGPEGQILMNLLVSICHKLNQIEANHKDVLSSFILAYISSPAGKDQKKAYKVLNTLVNLDQELVKSLVSIGEIKFCDNSARKKRLKVYHKLIMSYQVGQVLPLLHKYLAELMHCLQSQNQNQKTRTLCKNYLKALSDKLIDHRLFMNLYNTVISAMASEINNIKSASIEILKILIKHLAFGQPRSMFSSLEEQDSGVFNAAIVVIIMLKDKSSDVIRAGLRFLKGILQVISDSYVGILCERVINAVFLKNNEVFESFKELSMILIEEFVRKCGFEEVLKVFPNECVEILYFVAKDIKRKMKKKGKKGIKCDDNMMIDVNRPGSFGETVEKVEVESSKCRYLNLNKIVKVEDYLVQGEIFVFNEDDREVGVGRDKIQKRMKVAENIGMTVEKQRKRKGFLEYDIGTLDRGKNEIVLEKLGKVVDKVELGMVKDLKVRKNKLN